MDSLIRIMARERFSQNIDEKQKNGDVQQKVFYKRTLLLLHNHRII